MRLSEFHNALRVLRSIDAYELGDPDWWEQFRDSPYLFFIRCDDDTADVIWRAMVARGVKETEMRVVS